MIDVFGKTQPTIESRTIAIGGVLPIDGVASLQHSVSIILIEGQCLTKRIIATFISIDVQAYGLSRCLKTMHIGQVSAEIEVVARVVVPPIHIIDRIGFIIGGITLR